MSQSGDRDQSALPHPTGQWPLGAFLPAAVLVAVTLLAYIPAMRGGFFWDDYTFLVHNPIIEARDGLRRIWFTTQPTEYLPLTYTTHWLEWRIWAGRPAGPHALNVLLHAAGAVLLWRVLARLRVPGPFDPAQRDRPEGTRMGGAWLAGLFFAVHPVAVASAAWIMERKNVLSMVFYLSSLLTFLKFDEMAGGRLGNWEIGKLGNSESGKLGDWEIGKSRDSQTGQSPNLHLYILSIILFLLALLAKTSIVMLPVILLLRAWWRRGTVSRKDLLRTLPFFALSLALGLVTVWFQQHNAIRSEIVRPEGFASRLAAAGWIPWFCLFKILLPIGLCAIYPRWNVPGAGLLAFLPLLLLLAGIAFLWTRRKTWGRAPLFASACFLVMLLPVLGFLNMAFTELSLVADHLQYAAMIAVIALSAGLLSRAVSAPRSAGRAAIAATAACAALLAVLTWTRASLYRDKGAPLWRDTLAKNPAAWMAHNNLAVILSQRPNASPAADEEALRHLTDAIALKHDFAVAYNNRGNVYDHMRQPALALADYDRAIELNPRYIVAYLNRALAHDAANRPAEAIADYTRVIALDPGHAQAYSNRAADYARTGNDALALEDYRRVTELVPDAAAAWCNRGNVSLQANLPAEAVQDYDKAISLRPGFAEAWFGRAVAYARLGRTDDAVRGYSQAIKLRPGYFQAYNNRGKIFAEARRFADAIQDYEKAITLKPDYAEAFYNLGNACADADRLSAAIHDYDRAIALKPDYREAYNNRAVVFYQMKEYNKALADVKMFQKLGGKPDPAFLKALTEAAKE